MKNNEKCQFERLEKLSKGNFIKTSIIVLVIISIFGVIFINRSKAKYRVIQSIQVVSGEVNYTNPDFSMLGVKLQSAKGSSDYISASNNEVPASGYKLKALGDGATDSYCTINGEKNNTGITISYANGSVSFNGIKKQGTRCYLFFDLIDAISSSNLLANIPKKHPNQGTPNFENTSCSNGCDDTTMGLFTATDDFGTSSYFRGSVDYNWVKFGKVGNADIWWRIIRFNGNGTIRLIYAGTGTTAPAENTTVTQLDSAGTAYNSSHTGAKYVKFMYDTNTSSTIKNKLDTWFSSTSNLNQSAQLNHIDTETGFCNDTGGSSSTGTQNYPSYNRLFRAKTPSLKCTSSNDLFTKIGSKGNNKLTYPVGLITADEVAYSGGVYNKANQKFYLYTGQAYWTMSPFYFNSGSNYAYVLSVYSNGYFLDDQVGQAYGVRPVINLKADTTFIGEGAKESPYTVVN